MKKSIFLRTIALLFIGLLSYQCEDALENEVFGEFAPVNGPHRKVLWKGC